MINFTLREEEKSILKALIGKKLLHLRHDPFDKFGQETVYGKVELFFEDRIVAFQYDYEPYPLFGSKDDDRPRFHVNVIGEEEAVSALQNVEQINVECGKAISSITLAEDCLEIEWDGKKDISKVLKAIIIGFDKGEIAIVGDYMMPLLDLIKGENVLSNLPRPGEDLENIPDVKYHAERSFVKID